MGGEIDGKYKLQIHKYSIIYVLRDFLMESSEICVEGVSRQLPSYRMPCNPMKVV